MARFFGSPGSLNDINLLYYSPTIRREISGVFHPSIRYEINGVKRTIPYYLADGIYPDWVIFVKSIREGLSRKEKAFTVT